MTEQEFKSLIEKAENNLADVKKSLDNKAGADQLKTIQRP